MIVVERHHIETTQEIVKLCLLSKELYNKCNYLMRKAWFGNEQLPNISILYKKMRNLDCYKNFYNTRTAMQTIRTILIDWSNFKKALIAWKKDPSKFKKVPKPPYYKKKLAQVIFYNETIKKKPLKLGIITPTNDLFSIKSDKKFKQVVLTPKTFGFVIDVQYERKEKQCKINEDKVCCIDPGVNNLLTITSDQHKPLLVNGRIVKSINQWYNKHPNKKNSKKRYFRIENYFHHTSKLVVQNCVKHNIGTIIIGKNDNWKQYLNMRKEQKQNFQYVPFYRLIQKIQYKAIEENIKVIVTEESYTSKASFLDHDPIPEYDKDKPSPEFSGKRIKRGLYRTGRTTWNADVNGSLNIGRKVIGEALYGIVNRSLVARPERINPLKAFCV
jgi:putative transposase